MTKPYGLLSDLHCHAWSQYASIDGTGVNTRLRSILAEMVRAADEVLAAGGDTLVLAGDLFHTRGALDPEVFNPVDATIKGIIARGVRFLALPGNHDLKSKESTELGNAFQSFGDRDGFKIQTTASASVCTSTAVAMVPWVSTLPALKRELEDLAAATICAEEIDLIIHAGIDGVLSGVPSGGLTPAYLAGLGFKRVFAGHYHHHTVFEDGKVVSIGATGHQTYSDVGTRAGFLIVHEDRIEHRASHVPNFVDVNGDTDPDEVPLIVDGNFVRVSGMKLTDRQVNDLRGQLLGFGAKGVSFAVERVSTVTRTAGVASPKATLEASVETYVAGKGFTDAAAVQSRCADILARARAGASS